MSAKASLIGKLPDPDLNGLATAAQAFLDNPEEVQTAIVRLRVRKMETDTETGDVTAKLGIEHIEVIGGSDESIVRSTMAAACEKRTGIKQLDGFEQSFRQSFGADFEETGEI